MMMGSFQEHQRFGFETQEDVRGNESDVDVVDEVAEQPLSITYQGNIYQFDNVNVEKVKDVLNALSGHHASFDHNVDSTYPTKDEKLPAPLNPTERQRVIKRYLEKRNRRVWGKRITYEVRKAVAERITRKKGQFARPEVGEPKPLTTSAVPEVLVAFTCKNPYCGSTKTPTSKNGNMMMRNGPDGPRTLCNACGLVWAKKGVFRVPKPGDATIDVIM